MPPISLLIKPASSLCNMRCQYCFYADIAQNRTVPSFGIMSPDTLAQLTQKALACADHYCAFAFQGGEPTLAGLAFFQEAVRLQKQYNTRGVHIHNAIQTNGLALDDAWAQFLHDNDFLVGLSLDGDAAIHNELRPDSAGKGTYNRVVHAADRMRRHDCQYNILCVVTNQIARHGARVYNHLKRHRYLQFIPCIDGLDGGTSPLSLTPALYLQFLKTTFDLYYHDFMRGQYVSIRAFDNYVQLLLGHPPENCAMQGTCSCNLVIEGDGGVYPCDFYVLDDWRLGNIREDTPEALFATQTAARFVESSRVPDAQCQACQWFALCRGGCRRDRDPGMGRPLAHNRFCEAFDGFFHYAYPRLEEIAHRAGGPRRG